MSKQLTVDEFKERLIVNGIASVLKNEKRPERRKGGVAGFELCRTLNSMADFEECLNARHKTERDMVSMQTFGAKERKAMNKDGMTLPQGECTTTIDDYWEYRYATLQVEHVFERMKVVWGQMGLYSGALSARAVLQTADILGVKE
jgi:hypothetical protein